MASNKRDRDQISTARHAEAASAWLKNLTETMERGKFEREVEHIERALADRQGA